MSLFPDLKIGILTCSDRCFAKESEDKSGPAVESFFNENISKLKADRLSFTTAIVPDDQEKIKTTLLEWSDQLGFNLIVTTGGTGFAPRDVTPEATKDVLHKEAPGLVVAMINASLQITPHAMLSRPAAGIRGQTLIVNVPGSPKGAVENLSAILPALPHAVGLVCDVTKHSTPKAHASASSSAAQT